VRCRIESLFVILACLLPPTTVIGQERGVLGLTMAVARDDGRQQGPARAPYVWSIEGALFVSDRIALGAEFLKPDDLQSLSSLPSRITETARSERTVLATVRGRIKREEPVALDAVAGIGGVREETTVSSTIRSFGVPSSVTTRTDTASWLACWRALRRAFVSSSICTSRRRHACITSTVPTRGRHCGPPQGLLFERHGEGPGPALRRSMSCAGNRN
jgi:hypothetical protein